MLTVLKVKRELLNKRKENVFVFDWEFWVVDISIWLNYYRQFSKPGFVSSLQVFIPNNAFLYALRNPLVWLKALKDHAEKRRKKIHFPNGPWTCNYNVRTNNISVLPGGLIHITYSSLPQNCKYFASKVFTVSEIHKSHIQIYWQESAKWTRVAIWTCASSPLTQAIRASYGMQLFHIIRKLLNIVCVFF